jgi:phenylacetate-coenzyme A ligase PaaK-like adenylate-forming protein
MWDKRSIAQQAQDQEAALRAQLVDAVGPFSPYWRERFKALGTTARKAAADLTQVAPVGERDVCPDGDPKGAAALVLQAGESGWALHAEGPRLRKALTSRLLRPGNYQAVVEADTRPTSFVFAGLGLRYPVASTRADLDVIARAGARLWQVLGLTRDDVVVAAMAPEASATYQGLQLAALGAGSPALFPGDDPDEVASALRLVPATVLALHTDTAADTLDDLDEAGAPLMSVTTVLLVGAPSGAERLAVEEALTRVGSSPRVLAVHVPEGHRLLWGECAEGTGLHTYPDLEVIQLVDPETGETNDGHGPDEVVVTQLGMRGSALLRWRTADLADSLETAACRCGRTVPRLVGVRRHALVPLLALRSGHRGVDLRGLAAALDGRADLADWRIVVGPSPRDDHDEVVVHVVPSSGSDDDAADVAVAVARDVRSAAGLLPTQVVVNAPGELPDGDRISRRVHQRV